MKKGFYSILSSTVLASSLLAVPIPGMAKEELTPKVISNVTIESTQILNHEGQQIKVVRDSFGVPHIYAETDVALFFGTGYAMAEDRLWQAELSRITASGRMSEVFGPGTDNKYISQDLVIRRDGYTDEETLKQFENLPDYVKRGLTSYINGINYYIENTKVSALPPEFQGKKPAKWSLVDALKVQQLMVRRFGESGGGELSNLNILANLQKKFGEKQGLEIFNTIYMKNDPNAPVSVPKVSEEKVVKKSSRNLDYKEYSNIERVAKQLNQEQNMKLEIEKEFGFPHKGGSNAWIVSPSKSESGGTLLLGGPQMGFSAPQIAHEVGLHGAGYNSVGMAFAGAGPIPLIGRGKDFAWTTTTGYGDQIDTFMLTINPENPNQYMYQGQWKDFEVRTETLKVAGKDQEDHKIYRSVYGPVIYKDEKMAYSQKRSHWGQEVNAMVGFFDFNKASNMKQFEKAAEKIPTSHNFLYSDKQGNIGYWVTGRNAIRVEGKDNRLPMKGDGSEDWQGIQSFETLPKAINPAQGYVANWNNKPSQDWEFTEARYGPTHRAKFILDQLDSMEKVTWADMEEINKRAGLVDLNAYFFKNLLLDKLNANGEIADSVMQAAKLVENWNMYQHDDNKDKLYDDAGLTIFRSWLTEVKKEVFKNLTGIGGESNDLLYSILNADNETLKSKYSFLGELDIDQITLHALEKVTEDLKTTYEGVEMDQWLTEISTINFSPLGVGKVDNILSMNRGTYNQIVEFTKNSDRSVNILPPGQSGNPFSKHFDDQRILYSNWEYKPMVLDVMKLKK